MRTDSPYPPAGPSGRSPLRGCSCAAAIIVLVLGCIGVIIAGGIYWQGGLALPKFVPEFVEEVGQFNRSMTAPPTLLFLAAAGEGEGIALINQPPGVRIERNDSVSFSDVPIYLGVYDQAGEGTELRWELEIDHEENPGDLKPITLANGEKTLLAAVGEELIAFDLAAGQELWRSPLSDIIPDNCAGCLRVAQDIVVVMTLNNVVEAYDLTTGVSRWQHTLADDTPPTTYDERIAFGLAAEQVILLDQNDDSDDVIVALALGTGTPAYEITPNCESEEGLSSLRNGSIVIDENAAEAVMVFSAFGFGPTCQQSWNLVTNTMNWQTLWDPIWELPFGTTTGLLALEARSEFYSADQDYLYFAIENEESDHPDQILAVDRANGAPRLLAENPAGHELTPLVAASGLVVIQARTTRGSEADTLWLVEAASGAVRWQYELANPGRYDVDIGIGPVWDVAIRDGELLVLETKNSDDHFQMTRLNLEDGARLYQTTGQLDDRAIAISEIHWTADSAYIIVVGDLYGVDLETGRVARRWPS